MVGIQLRSDMSNNKVYPIKKICDHSKQCGSICGCKKPHICSYGPCSFGDGVAQCLPIVGITKKTGLKLNLKKGVEDGKV